MNFDDNINRNYINQHKNNDYYVTQKIMDEIAMSPMEDIEKQYLYEACYCAANDRPLAAVTMLSCAAEHLFGSLCKSYYQYLKKHGTSVKISNYERKVLHAKSLYDKLKAFENLLDSNGDIFDRLRIKNSPAYFRFLQIIHITRNQAGLAVATDVSAVEAIEYIEDYKDDSKKIHKVLVELPNL